MKKEFGIYIPPHVCRDKRLTPATRIVYGQIAQLAKKKGYCHAQNLFLAKSCGLNRDTVSGAISTLAQRGLATISSEDGVRRICPVFESSEPPADCGNLPHETAVGDAELGTGDSGASAENDFALAENDRGHLKRVLSKSKSNEEDRESSSLLLIEEERAVEHSNSKTDSGASGSPVSYNLQHAKDLVAEWGRQVLLRVVPRIWERRKANGDENNMKLGMPSVGIPSQKEIDQAVSLALELWPGSDPEMAFRQLLRACACTQDRCDTLQQYAYLAAGGSITVRSLLRIGGNGDPLSFARDSAGAVPPPPVLSFPGTVDDAALLRDLSYDAFNNWSFDPWLPCWVEAAGRLKSFTGVPSQCFMAAAFDLYESGGKTTPLPWFADSLSAESLADFAEKYGTDRRNAWRGGRCRRPSDPRRGDDDRYEYRCVGWDVAKTAAQGKTSFESKSCLLCAATELRLMPDLVETVPWDRGAEALVGLLEELAASTACDAPPHRGVDCGQRDCAVPSYIRCLHGVKEGTWLAGNLSARN